MYCLCRKMRVLKSFPAVWENCKAGFFSRKNGSWNLGRVQACQLQQLNLTLTHLLESNTHRFDLVRRSLLDVCVLTKGVDK